MRLLHQLAPALLVVTACVSAPPASAALITDLNYGDDEEAFIWNWQVNLGVVGINNAITHKEEWENQLSFNKDTAVFSGTSQHLKAPHGEGPNPNIFKFGADVKILSAAQIPIDKWIVLDIRSLPHPKGHSDLFIFRYQRTGPSLFQFSLAGDHQSRPPVPEPSTWAMMLLGFGFVGGAMRSVKRRQKLTVSYA